MNKDRDDWTFRYVIAAVLLVTILTAALMVLTLIGILYQSFGIKGPLVLFVGGGLFCITTHEIAKRLP